MGFDWLIRSHGHPGHSFTITVLLSSHTPLFYLYFYQTSMNSHRLVLVFLSCFVLLFQTACASTFAFWKNFEANTSSPKADQKPKKALKAGSSTTASNSPTIPTVPPPKKRCEKGLNFQISQDRTRIKGLCRFKRAKTIQSWQSDKFFGSTFDPGNQTPHK